MRALYSSARSRIACSPSASSCDTSPRGRELAEHARDHALRHRRRPDRAHHERGHQPVAAEVRGVVRQARHELLVGAQQLDAPHLALEPADARSALSELFAAARNDRKSRLKISLRASGVSAVPSVVTRIVRCTVRPVRARIDTVRPITRALASRAESPISSSERWLLPSSAGRAMRTVHEVPEPRDVIVGVSRAIAARRRCSRASSASCLALLGCREAARDSRRAAIPAPRRTAAARERAQVAVRVLEVALDAHRAEQEPARASRSARQPRGDTSIVRAPPESRDRRGRRRPSRDSQRGLARPRGEGGALVERVGPQQHLAPAAPVEIDLHGVATSSRDRSASA